MIKIAAQPPSINADAIARRGLTELGFSQTATPLPAFGLSVGSNMAIVPGRILSPPAIKYGTASPKVDDRASWNLRDVRFSRGTTLSNWAVLIISDPSTSRNPENEFPGPADPALKATISGFMQMCRTSGIAVLNDPQVMGAPIPPKDPADPIRGQAINAIRQKIISQNKPTFVLTLLSNTDKHVYNGIKHLFDSYLDLPNVCVQSSKIRNAKGEGASYIPCPPFHSQGNRTTTVLCECCSQGEHEAWRSQVCYFTHAPSSIRDPFYSHTLDKQSTAWLDKSPTMLVGIDVYVLSTTSGLNSNPHLVALILVLEVSSIHLPLQPW